MSTVADSSPICYLRMIEQIELLPALFGEIAIPEAVVQELSDEGAPATVREWIEHPSPWLLIERVACYPEQFSESLHSGEQEVIALARQISAGLVIIDEKAARRTAKEYGLNVTGLIGVLCEAATRGMIDIIVAAERLSQTNFRISPQLLKVLVDQSRFH
ncbi:MAG: DUF3368 domain-containing protein [Syntrophobacteraceae bacterium]